MRQKKHILNKRENPQLNLSHTEHVNTESAHTHIHTDTHTHAVSTHTYIGCELRNFS